MIQSVNVFSGQYVNKYFDLKDKRIYENFIYRDEDDKLRLNSVKFINSLKHICKIVVFNEDYLVYNYNTKIYDKLDVINLSRIIKFILDTIDRNFWSLKLESFIVTIINRDFEFITDIPIYKDYIFFENGIYNIQTKKLEKYTPNILATYKINNKYVVGSSCNRFLSFINIITNSDKELTMLIQEIMGYVLVNNTKAQKFFLFYGEGSNGKSVLEALIRAMVGKENTSSVSLEQLRSNFVIGNIVGKLVNIASENESDFEAEKLKAITSGDSITIDQKYKEPYQHIPTCKMIFISNSLPNTSDNSYGFYRRLIIVPFNKTIKSEDRDVNLISKLLGEIEGILQWSIMGLERLVENNYQFTNPSEVSRVIKQYKEEQDPVYLFYKDKLTYKVGARINKKKILESYLLWLNTRMISPRGTDSSSKFWKELRRVTKSESIELDETKSGNYYYIKNFELVA
ncbi:MAG: phage/plasmid primase, P4 family [Terrisporobacter sp.]